MCPSATSCGHDRIPTSFFQRSSSEQLILLRLCLTVTDYREPVLWTKPVDSSGQECFRSDFRSKWMGTSLVLSLVDASEVTLSQWACVPDEAQLPCGNCSLTWASFASSHFYPCLLCLPSILSCSVGTAECSMIAVVLVLNG